MNLFNKYLLNTMIYEALRTQRQKKSQVPWLSSWLRKAKFLIKKIWSRTNSCFPLSKSDTPRKGKCTSRRRVVRCLWGGNIELRPSRMSRSSAGGVRDVCRAPSTSWRRLSDPHEQAGPFSGRKVRMLNFLPAVSPEETKDSKTIHQWGPGCALGAGAQDFM